MDASGMRNFRVSTKIYEIGDSEISISGNQPIRINQAFNREKKFQNVSRKAEKLSVI